jgi:predicted nucleic acid-binding protein
VIAFLDSSALIYTIEAREPFVAAARAALRGLMERDATARIALSRLTWLECRVGPSKSGNAATLADYDAFFARPDLVWVELTREVVELATAIRVRHGLRTPDALQAASCLQLGPDHLLLTGDGAFERVDGLKVALLS